MDRNKLYIFGILIVFCIVVIQSADAVVDCINPNEAETAESLIIGPCPLTCANMLLSEETLISTTCAVRCYCPSGYVFNNAGECVLPTECPVDEIQCPANQEYSSCNNDPCKPAPSCSNTLRAIIKADVIIIDTPICNSRILCVQGCRCKTGLVLDDVNTGSGQCITVPECQKRKICRINQQYLTCGTLCPRSCANKDYQIRCMAGCNVGCFCLDGFVQDGHGNCIPESECPLNCRLANEIEDPCPSQNQPTCAEPNPYSANLEIRCKPKCVCRPPFVRDEVTNECVDRQYCETKQCKQEHEVFTDCRSCSTTCKDYLLCTVLQCKIVCQPGCQCKPGYAYSANGICIPEQYCKCDEAAISKGIIC